MQAVTITRKHVVMVSTHIYFFMCLILISMINIPHFGKRITDYLTSRLTRMKSVCFFSTTWTWVRIWSGQPHESRGEERVYCLVNLFKHSIFILHVTNTQQRSKNYIEILPWIIMQGPSYGVLFIRVIQLSIPPIKRDRHRAVLVTLKNGSSRAEIKRAMRWCCVPLIIN